jgi:dolichol-phosphate mannosyltransferase
LRAQGTAALAAMVFNFALNNQVTYRDQRLRGAAWLRGLAVFTLACSVGLFANVGVAAWLFGSREGWVLSGVAGTLVAAVWNFVVSRTFVWNRARRGA